jgi:hypothetical protein
MLSLAIFGIIVLLYNGLSGASGEMQKYVPLGTRRLLLVSFHGG